MLLANCNGMVLSNLREVFFEYHPRDRAGPTQKSMLYEFTRSIKFRVKEVGLN